MSEVHSAVVKKRFEICPQCNYENGFHIILIEDPAAGPAEMKFQLKCPNCSHIYDLNLYCSLKK